MPYSEDRLLKWSPPNGKTEKLGNVWSLSLLAGRTCPGAHKCKACVVETREGRRLRDSASQEFRCFSAMLEAAYRATYEQHKHNTILLREVTGDSTKAAYRLLRASYEARVPATPLNRFHIAGDFFTMRYLRAAARLAESFNDRLFYGYTKSLHLLSAYYDAGWKLPDNFRLTLSAGGKYDAMIADLAPRGHAIARVFRSEVEAHAAGLVVDHDDSHAAFTQDEFALIVHGSQPKRPR
jgi:hypothetical protein